MKGLGNAVLGLLALAFAVALALIVIVYFKPVRTAVGLGNLAPTGLPAKLGAQ